MAETDTARAERLSLLLALEIERIVRQLEDRSEFLLTVWSRHRRRDAFLDSMFSRWNTVGMGDLVALDTEVLSRVHAFYDALEAFRLYVSYTEDMPTTLRDAFEVHLRRLRRTADEALELLGRPEAPDEASLPPAPSMGLEAEGEG